MGVSSTVAVPTARHGAVSWTNSSGNFWLFGGQGYGSTGTFGILNDLWEYSPYVGTWTWVSGTDVTNAPGIYGTQGAASTTNAPGARFGAVSWNDAYGNLWLFGGQGYGLTTGALGYLSDLWEYNPVARTWTWVNGSNTIDFHGSWGAGATVNSPGARYGAASWADSSGNAWLFGGNGFNGGPSGPGLLNDLWEYSPNSAPGSAGTWTRISGSKLAGAAGVYGTRQAASSANAPGGRLNATSWQDGFGNFWLFGGEGFPSAGSAGDLNDLWAYTPSTVAGLPGTWTWVDGSTAAGVTPQTTVAGATAPALGTPGARDSLVSWTDSFGNVWLFGGNGFDSTGLRGQLNDLWEHPAPLMHGFGPWTWVSGSNLANQLGVYGSRAGGPILTFFLPSAFPEIPAAANNASCPGQLAVTGTYPNGTVWGPGSNYFWAASQSGGAVGFAPVRGAATPISFAASGAPVVTGPDGAVWFPVQLQPNATGIPYQIVRIDQAGNETDYPFSSSQSANGIAVGPDKNLWFTTSGGNASIGQMVISGVPSGATPVVNMYPITSAFSSSNSSQSVSLIPGITSGPTALWFLATTSSIPSQFSFYLGEITPTGQMLTFALPQNPFFTPTEGDGLLAFGSDNNVWIVGSELTTSASGQTITTCGVLQLTPQSQSTSTPPTQFFPIPTVYCLSNISAGPDGALWGGTNTFNAPPVLVRMTTNGVISYVPIPSQPGYVYQPGGTGALTWDSAGVLWFSVYTAGSSGFAHFGDCFIGRLKPQ